MTSAISDILMALQALVAKPPEELEYTRLSALTGSALKKLRAARADSEALTTGHETDVYERLTAEMSRLRSLLVAISHDPGVVERIKAPPTQLAATVDRIVENSASTRIHMEKLALEEVLANVDGVFVREVPDEDPFPSSVRGHQWIVGIPPPAWEDATTAATRLDRSVVGVPVTLVCVTADLVLPFGLRVPWSNDKLVVVPPQEISQIAMKLSRRTVPSTARQFFFDVLDDLVLASWKAARMRLRPKAWAFEKHPAPREHLERARHRMHEGSQNTTLVELLGALADRVEREILRGDSRPIAAAVAVPRLLAVEGTDGDEVTELLEAGTLLAIGEELAACVATGGGGHADEQSPTRTLHY